MMKGRPPVSKTEQRLVRMKFYLEGKTYVLHQGSPSSYPLPPTFCEFVNFHLPRASERNTALHDTSVNSRNPKSCEKIVITP